VRAINGGVSTRGCFGSLVGDWWRWLTVIQEHARHVCWISNVTLHINLSYLHTQKKKKVLLAFWREKTALFAWPTLTIYIDEMGAHMLDYVNARDTIHDYTDPMGSAPKNGIRW
jgi:hypothetical protein